MLVAFRVTFVVVFPKNTWGREEEVGKKKKEKRNKPGDKQRVRTKSFSLSLFSRNGSFFPLDFQQYFSIKFIDLTPNSFSPSRIAALATPETTRDCNIFGNFAL